MAEIEQYLGILVKMGLVHMPRYKCYWSPELCSTVIVDSQRTAADVECQEIIRWDRKENMYVNVYCPAIVKEYNEHMGGVDLFDTLMSLYKVTSQEHKMVQKNIPLDLSLIHI